MNIAIINTIAKTGSTGKIACGLKCYFQNQGHNAYIFSGRQDGVEAKESDFVKIGNNVDAYYHALMTRLFGNEGTYSRRATTKILQKFDELNIQAVCMLNLHGYYINYPMLFDYISNHDIASCYLMLDEYAFTGKCTYTYECDKFKTECISCSHLKDYPANWFIDSARSEFYLKKESYDRAPDCMFIGIPYTVERAKESRIMHDRLFFEADEAVDQKNIFYPREEKKIEELRIKLGIPNENKVILTVALFSDTRKGGKFFLKMAKEMEKENNISFVHVGFDGDTNICPNNYVPIRYVKDQGLLATYYSMADLFVQTSFAETIPASCLEALSCGTKVLGFNISGIPSCADEEHGTFVEPGNITEMVRVINSTPKKNKKSIQSCRDYAVRRYDSEKYYEKILNVLTKLTDNKKCVLEKK